MRFIVAVAEVHTAHGVPDIEILAAKTRQCDFSLRLYIINRCANISIAMLLTIKLNHIPGNIIDRKF
jgi:hypothetical protein